MQRSAVNQTLDQKTEENALGVQELRGSKDSRQTCPSILKVYYKKKVKIKMEIG